MKPQNIVRRKNIQENETALLVRVNTIDLKYKFNAYVINNCVVPLHFDCTGIVEINK